jgi:hypothetical protein
LSGYSLANLRNFLGFVSFSSNGPLAAPEVIFRGGVPIEIVRIAGLSKRLSVVLAQKGYTVLMTRKTDVYVPLQTRTKLPTETGRVPTSPFM